MIVEIFKFFINYWYYFLIVLVIILGIIFRKQVLVLWRLILRLLKYLIKNWNWVLLWMGVIAFAFLSYKKANPNIVLILGGAILILYGLNSIFSKSEFKLGWMPPALMISIGILSIMTAILLPKSIDIFALVFLLLVGLNYLFYYLSGRGANLVQNLLSLIIFTLIFYLNFGITSGIFSYLKGTTEFTLSSYTLLLLTFALFFFSSFAFIEKLFISAEGIAKKINPQISILHNRYVYLTIAANLVIFIAGYFYLQNISTDKIRDFFVIIGIALISSFSSVSAFKNICKTEPKLKLIASKHN